MKTKNRKQRVVKPTTVVDYQKICDYRDDLIKKGVKVHQTTVDTGKRFKCHIMTVYNAICYVRSAGQKGSAE